MITIYSIVYNEEIILKHFIDHYRSRFSNCRIVLYDNISSDNTRIIAKENNCEVYDFETNGQINEFEYLKIKNNCWKSANTDWVLVCDADEFLDINKKQLVREASRGTSIIKPLGYNMVNMNDDLNIDRMEYGVRSEPYDKCVLFNKKLLNEINYAVGCHTCAPTGKVRFNKESYNLYHYKYINKDYLVQRYNIFSARLSQVNLKYGMGYQYNFGKEKIIKDFDDIRAAAIKLR